MCNHGSNCLSLFTGSWTIYVPMSMDKKYLNHNQILILHLVLLDYPINNKNMNIFIGILLNKKEIHTITKKVYISCEFILGTLF